MLARVISGGNRITVALDSFHLASLMQNCFRALDWYFTVLFRDSIRIQNCDALMVGSRVNDFVFGEKSSKLNIGTIYQYNTCQITDGATCNSRKSVLEGCLRFIYWLVEVQPCLFPIRCGPQVPAALLLATLTRSSRPGLVITAPCAALVKLFQCEFTTSIIKTVWANYVSLNLN